MEKLSELEVFNSILGFFQGTVRGCKVGIQEIRCFFFNDFFSFFLKLSFRKKQANLKFSTLFWGSVRVDAEVSKPAFKFECSIPYVFETCRF